jgi:hypothetical protein
MEKGTQGRELSRNGGFFIPFMQIAKITPDGQVIHPIDIDRVATTKAVIFRKIVEKLL